MKNIYNCLLKIILLIALTCSASSVFAATETIDGNYILTSNKIVKNNDTLVIKGNLDIPNNIKLSINQNAILRIIGNLTISARGALELLNNSKLLVSGNVYQDGTSPLGWGLILVEVGDINAKKRLL